jgi:hypothetical protein
MGKRIDKKQTVVGACRECGEDYPQRQIQYLPGYGPLNLPADRRNDWMPDGFDSQFCAHCLGLRRIEKAKARLESLRENVAKDIDREASALARLVAKGSKS